jgi:hypothetical protein
VFYSKPSTYSPRASYTYVFKYHNAFVGVRVDGLPGKISVGDAMSLAKVVLGRLQSATA